MSAPTTVEPNSYRCIQWPHRSYWKSPCGEGVQLDSICVGLGSPIQRHDDTYQSSLDSVFPLPPSMPLQNDFPATQQTLPPPRALPLIWMQHQSSTGPKPPGNGIAVPAGSAINVHVYDSQHYKTLGLDHQSLILKASRHSVQDL